MDCPSFSKTLSETLAAWGLPERLLDGVDHDARPLLWRALRAVLEALDAPQQGWGVPSVSRPADGAGTCTAGVSPAGGAGTCTAAFQAASAGGAAPAPTGREPLPFAYQHYARPRFQQCNLRELDLTGWHKKLRLALWMAAEALEALCTLPKADEYRTLLGEQCTWMGQLYADLKRRAGPFFAPMIFQGELRFLQHRASAAVTDLLFTT